VGELINGEKGGEGGDTPLNILYELGKPLAVL